MSTLSASGFFFGSLGTILLRYFLFAGALDFWVRSGPRASRFDSQRIEGRKPSSGQVRREIGWSLLTSLIFAFVGWAGFLAWQAGWTKVYLSVDEKGWGWFFLSLFLMIAIHETYFYWTHRWMHLPRVFRLFHRGHHESRPPTAWAAFSFHPLEALVEALILPAFLFFFPVHPGAYVVFLFYMTIFSVIHHCGVELYPRGFARHRVFRAWVSATHHQAHHARFTVNYGLYFNVWDRWMKTQDPRYEESFRKPALPLKSWIAPSNRPVADERQQPELMAQPNSVLTQPPASRSPEQSPSAWH